MRKLVIAVATAAVALGAAAGCTTAPPAGSTTTSPPVTTPAADDTKAVCTEATAYASTASAAVMAKYAEGAAAISANDLLKAQAAATEGKKLLTDWSAKYRELSAKQINPEVKTALDNVANFADQTASATSADPAALQSMFADLNGKLATACSAV